MSENSDNSPARNDALPRWIAFAGMVLFGIFVVVLFFFGQPPILIRQNIGTKELDVNIVSCTGILGGLFGMYFLARYYRVVILLPTLKATLSIMGSLGLILHTGYSGWAVFKAGGHLLVPKVIAYDVSDRTRLSPAGTEHWQLDGKMYLVDSTYYLLLSRGLVYVIDHPCDFRAPPGLADKQALAIAYPLMKHAYEREYYKRTEFVRPGGAEIECEYIYVALVNRKGGIVTGYRVGLPISELKALILQGGPVPSGPTSRP